ncbi:MAG: hypothetical protein ABIX01_11330 [Chitinophagaceae bacterium]
MQLIEVTDKPTAKDFIRVNVIINKNDPNYIRPLDKDVAQVFDKEKNKYFRFGEVKRWILKDDAGYLIGRIAAYANKKYRSKGDEQPTGGIGFFDCINSREAADTLFNTAKQWLMDNGFEAMDGPINFGERDRWWGLLVEGFHEPLYCMNYNQPYYQELFEGYGFKVFFNQLCWGRQVTGRLPDRFYAGHDKVALDPNFSARRPELNHLDKYAQDFSTVYNAAFAGHDGNKQMDIKVAKKLFQTMKPVMDINIAWFAYYKDQPIAFYINLPELNQLFKHLNGNFNLLAKLKFLWLKWRKKNQKFTGIVFGITPEYQGKGVDYFMIVEAAKIIQYKTNYTETELQWQGDFNPKIINISKNLEFTLTRKLTTYRYLFDRTKEFKRHPIF